MNKKRTFRTLFPREEYMFISTRLLAVLITLVWVLFSPKPENFSFTTVILINLTFACHLGALYFLIRRYANYTPILYKFTFGFDLVFISFLVYFTGGIDSHFYLYYYLLIAFSAYYLGLKGGILIALLSTTLYFLINLESISEISIYGFGLRMSVAWFYAIAIGFFAKHMKNSSNRLLNLLDVLNERTTELEKTQIQLETIYETSRSLAEIHNMDEVLEEINNIADGVLGFPMTSVLILDETRTQLEVVAKVVNGSKQIFNIPPKIDLSGVCGRVIKTGKIQKVDDLKSDMNYIIGLEGGQSEMAVPMRARGKIVGVLNAESTKEKAFSERDIKLFSILASSAGMAIDNARMHKQISDLTMIDDLTGIYNYRYFVQKLDEERKRATRYDLPLSLIMMDLDWFKKTNDTYGHEVGNIVLKELVKVVQSCIRDTDTFCRYGGEEFIIILPQTKSAEAAVLAERIRAQVELYDFGKSTGVKNLKTTISLGVTAFPDNGLPTLELVQTVDMALYRAKGSGKNMVCAI